MKNSLLTVSLFLTCFAACQAQPNDPGPTLSITPAITRSLIDSIKQSLYHNYIFPDTALKMAARLEKEFEKGAYNTITDPNQLARQLLHDMQQTHHDGHLRLGYDPGMAKRMAQQARDNPQRNRTDDSLALAMIRYNNFFLNKVEVLPGNIGYIGFSGFTGMVDEARPTFTAAFRLLQYTNAIIIDLRHNGGGSPNMVNQTESYFFSERTHMNDIVDRLAGKKIDFWTDPAKADGVILHMPVYILTARLTFSGAEDFTYGMQSVKRATVVGDTTGGGAHPVRPFSIGLGFVAGIPYARSLNPYTLTDWEGKGVIPDIPVPQENALQTAIETILTQQMKNAATDREKRHIQWLLNYNLSKLSAGTVPQDSSSLARYTGVYQGGLNFYVRGNTLYCKNAERGNAIFSLLPIKDNTFVLDENVEVEFLPDTAGNFTRLKMLWSNGSETVKEKQEANLK